jgi:hypothetical protein
MDANEVAFFAALRSISAHKIMRRQRGVDHFSFTLRSATRDRDRATGQRLESRTFCVKRYSEFVALAATLHIKIPLPQRNRKGLLGIKTGASDELLHARFDGLTAWLNEMFQSLLLVYDDVMSDEAAGGGGRPANPSTRTQLLLQDIAKFVHFLRPPPESAARVEAVERSGAARTIRERALHSPPTVEPPPQRSPSPPPIKSPSRSNAKSTGIRIAGGPGALLRRHHAKMPATPPGLPDEFQRFTQLRQGRGGGAGSAARRGGGGGGALQPSVEELDAAEARLEAVRDALASHRDEVHVWIEGPVRLNSALRSTMSALAPRGGGRANAAAAAASPAGRRHSAVCADFANEWERRVVVPLARVSTPPTYANVQARKPYLDDVAAAIEAATLGAVELTAAYCCLLRAVQ